MTVEVWAAENTTPADIDSALRGLLEEQHVRGQAYAPARVLNMVAVVDASWRGEVMNRLERVGRYHPSRTILCAVEEGRTTLDASARLSTDGTSDPSLISVVEERVDIRMGEVHLRRLDAIVDPLILADLITVVWAPHGHHDAIEAMLGLADVVLLDSLDDPNPARAIGWVCRLEEHAYVVDLAWLRGTPWRERIAATFDPDEWRPALRQIARVVVRHRPDSALSGVLMLGWLASRLGWEPGSLVEQSGRRHGRARAGKLEVSLQLEPVDDLSAPGLGGITLETADGMTLSLDRSEGGLAAKRRTRDGRESSWVVLGASRGEAGILGEGIRQALLRDPTYAPAVRCAQAMLA
ncbi:MAG TPA: glucose-6-phosphate dehydrogenase assembly protein OpcA [Thermoleophilaceae bacterium]|nr:glucose-6-phosphate dehydrogenase assembly protein OpcA [Thermoleophilaceae bacterium]